MLVAYLSSPQQWNRYCYVTGNPLKYVDPNGARIEIVGTEEERKLAFQRIKDVVGEKGAKGLYVKEENGHFYVEAKNTDALAATGLIGAHIAIMIDSQKTTEFRVAKTFQVKVSEWFGLVNKVVTRNVSYYGGGATVGADESVTGNTQVFVHPDAGSLATDALGSNVLGATRSDDGKPLFFYNDVVDAHELGHAYANMIMGIPLAGSRASEGYYKARDMENFVRERRHMPNRRRIE